MEGEGEVVHVVVGRDQASLKRRQQGGAADDGDENGGGVGGAGGLADSFNHTSGPRQFTSFCHQVCQERRTARELKSGSRGGASGVAGECVQRKLGVGEDFGTLIGCGRWG